MKKTSNSLPKKVSTVLILISLVLVGYLLGVKQDALRTIFANPFSAGVSQQNAISAKQLANEMKNKNFTLINVHTPYEGEIAQTDTFIPYDKIVENSDSLPKDKNTPIILYCQTSRMSDEAMVTIQKMGYTNVRQLAGGMKAWEKAKQTVLNLQTLTDQVLPQNGATLSVSWGDIWPKLVAAGVIDLEKFRATVKPTPDQEKILTERSDEKITITTQNSQFIVDALWALGLAQKSIVYTDGPMGQEYKKDAGNFSSTGGWTLARGNATQYLGQLDLIPLTDAQQQKVASIAKNVYRPCCGNSTWFPDCNHGMAALAAIELMVYTGMDEKQIYKEVLALNSFFFPTNYLTTATYFARQGTAWDKVDAKEALGATYSSSQGAAEISKKVGPLPYGQQSAGGCGA